MKKLFLLVVAAMCFSFTALANKDASGIVVRGEGSLSQYKKALSQEAAGKIGRAVNSMLGDGDYVVLDLTPDVYEFFNLNMSNNGPTDSKILMYVNNFENNLYDYKVTVVYDIYQMDGKTYVGARVLAPSGAELYSTSRNGKAGNLEELIELFAPVTSDVIQNVVKKK